MPQPLSNFLTFPGDHSTNFTPDALKREPELAALIAEAIGRCAAIEAGIGDILIRILHADTKPAFAMFTSLMDTSARRTLVEAAAKAGLSDSDFATFKIVSSITKVQIDARNKFAHWIWGYSPQVPNALLLADPRYLLNRSHDLHKHVLLPLDKQMEAVIASYPDVTKHIRIDFDQVYVYRKSDFEQTIRDFSETMEIVRLFAALIDPAFGKVENEIRALMPNRKPNDPYAQIREKLLSQRLFQEYETQARNRQKNG
jgi:hypothetical protein